MKRFTEEYKKWKRSWKATQLIGSAGAPPVQFNGKKYKDEPDPITSEDEKFARQLFRIVFQNRNPTFIEVEAATNWIKDYYEQTPPGLPNAGTNLKTAFYQEFKQ